ncbi:hypothetical protein SRHO_G00077990 [Serrasalmus rhombeus]
MRPAGKSKEEIGQTVVLEQFLNVINPELRSWITERSPTSPEQAVDMAEAFVSARRAERDFHLGKPDSTNHSMGPLPRTKNGNRFILVILDYATRYPEAFALKKVKTRQIVNALIQLISRVGVPREILTDQGTNFTSKQIKQVYNLLGIRAIHTTAWHPQTDGLTERFNKTLKQTLRKLTNSNGTDWDTWLPYVLFGYREVPQASTGFSPFELLYGRQVRGPLDVLKEAWEGENREQKLNILSFVLKTREAR